MRDRFEFCEEHEDTKIFYDYRLACPLCEANKEIDSLKEKIERLEEKE